MINIQDLHKSVTVYRKIYNTQTQKTEKAVCTICTIGEQIMGGEFCRVTHPNDTFRFPVECEDLEGIPLTERILLDSGFKSIVLGGKPYFNYDLPKEQLGKGSFTPTFQVEMSISGLFRFTYCLKEIPCHSTGFVHDLQNAYYQATGENLKIVIK